MTTRNSNPDRDKIGADTAPRCRASLLLSLSAMLLGACHQAAPPAAIEESEANAATAQAGVELTPEQIQKMGIVTSVATAAAVAPEAAGYAVVVGHDVVAQAVADVATAEAAVRQSRAALARVRNLSDTPGAFSAETRETTERQAAADEAALTLTRRKLSATFGQQPPWRNAESSALLGEIASGQSKLIRATFPLGTLSGSHPMSLRLARLDPAGNSASWQTGTVWDAPADAVMPGRSLFAVLKGSDAGEGERLAVWAPVGTAEPGVVVPRAAVVISDGQYWCYVETRAGTFERKGVDAARPVADGYFVREGIAIGVPIVVAAAGLLLARETNPSSEAE